MNVLRELDDTPDRVGIIIRRHGTWRETVAHYGSYRDLSSECVARYDSLVLDGWVPAWAALRALDDHCCADVIMSNETMPIERVNKMVN